uniref:SWIM-type domain-containing protein n=1 Tax=viral metagenome TaxID=1070528 RepID=A0A6C0AC08_9ZZZZ
MNNIDANNRKSKALNQKLYVIEKNIQNKFRTDFVVIGSTGNIYTVSIKSEPECSCPDNSINRFRCKHIYFCLLKLMKVDSEDVDEEFYTNLELEYMFVSQPKELINRASQNNIDKYINFKKGIIHTEVKKRFHYDDLCGICLDQLYEHESLDYCKYKCGKCVHAKCMEIMIKHNKNNHKTVKCIYCNQEWNKKKILNSKYINIS